MAVIRAEWGRIKYFQEQWEAVPRKLEGAISDREDLIAHARLALEKGQEEAEKIRDKTRQALDKARDCLERAKRTECGPSEHECREAERCERAYEWACRQLEKVKAQRERLDEGAARCTDRQDRAMESIKRLEKKGSGWLLEYIQTLLDAKRAIYEDVPSGGGSFRTADGGYESARSMTDEERTALQEKTGWSEKTLNKCQIRPDGSVWLRTNNSIKDMETYNGVWFQRDTITIGEVRVEGIFPKFNAVYEPEITLPEELWKGRGNGYNVHFAWCRSMLKAAVESDLALAARFSAEERSLIEKEKPLPGYTWHHHQQPGKMQLVRSDEHSAGMHGVNHTGGNSLWGKTELRSETKTGSRFFGVLVK